MRAEDLLKAIGEIDDEIIEASEELSAGTGSEAPQKPKVFKFRPRYVAYVAAACLLIGLLGIYGRIRADQKMALEEAAMESDAFSHSNEAAAAAGEEYEEAEEEYEEAAEEYDEAMDDAAMESAEETIDLTEDAPKAAMTEDTGGSADNPVGIILTADEVTASGMTLVCSRSGVTITGELETGTAYVIERLENDVWETVPYVSNEVGWNDVAQIIPEGEETTWKLDWSHIYGKLGRGTYRIGKEFMDFRGTGDYDTYMVYCTFDIK